MAADVTLEEFYVRTAQKLKIIEANEPLSAEDRQVFVDRYPGVWALLEGRGLALWGEEDPIPQRYVLMVEDLLAEQCAHVFVETYAAPWAIPELNRQVAPDYRHATTTFEDF